MWKTLPPLPAVERGEGYCVAGNELLGLQVDRDVVNPLSAQSGSVFMLKNGEWRQIYTLTADQLLSNPGLVCGEDEVLVLDSGLQHVVRVDLGTRQPHVVFPPSGLPTMCTAACVSPFGNSNLVGVWTGTVYAFYADSPANATFDGLIVLSDDSEWHEVQLLGGPPPRETAVTFSHAVGAFFGPRGKGSAELVLQAVSGGH
jgi:hypothetical protein